MQEKHHFKRNGRFINFVKHHRFSLWKIGILFLNTSHSEEYVLLLPT